MLLVPLNLNACATAPASPASTGSTGGPEVSADHARDATVEVGRAVIAAIGTKPWVFIAGPAPEECTRPDHTRGVAFSWAARGPAGPHQSEHSKAARTTLAARGYTVRVQNVPEGAMRVVGRSARLGIVEFDARDTADGLVVTSSCAVGRFADYIHQTPQGLDPSTAVSS